MNVKINSTGGLSVGDTTNGYKDLATKEYVDNKTFPVSWNDVSGKPTTFTPASHNHSASDINSGTLDIARIPTGTSSTTVSLGNHTHSNYVDTTNKQTVAGVKKFDAIYVGNDSIENVTKYTDLESMCGFSVLYDQEKSSEVSLPYYTIQFADENGGYVYMFSQDSGQIYYHPKENSYGTEFTINLPKKDGTLITNTQINPAIDAINKNFTDIENLMKTTEEANISVNSVASGWSFSADGTTWNNKMRFFHAGPMTYIMGQAKCSSALTANTSYTSIGTMSLPTGFSLMGAGAGLPSDYYFWTAASGVMGFRSFTAKSAGTSLAIRFMIMLSANKNKYTKTTVTI